MNIFLSKEAITWVKIYKHGLCSMFNEHYIIIFEHNFYLNIINYMLQVAQVCAYILGIDLHLVQVKPTTNLTSPNNNGTGGSVTSESASYVRFLFFTIEIQYY